MYQKTIAINNEKINSLLSKDDYNKLWRLTGPLLGTVNLRQPTIIRNQKDLKDHPEMKNQIGGISIPEKNTIINIQEFIKTFGPFTLDDLNNIKQWIKNEIDSNRDPKKTAITKNLLSKIVEQASTGVISIENALFQIYIMMLMAHEMGHHKWIPYDYKTALLLVDSVYKVTKDKDQAEYITNIYEDLVINDHLFKQRGLPLHLLYKKITGKNDDSSLFLQINMRTYELLWQQSILPPAPFSAELERDAMSLVKIIQESKPQNYIIKAREAAEIMNKYQDIQSTGKPSSFDKDISSGTKKESKSGQGTDVNKQDDQVKKAALKAVEGMSLKQDGENGSGTVRPLSEYQEIMKRMNLADNPMDAAIMYYLDQATQYAVQFPEVPRLHGEEVMEGIKAWDPSSDPIERLDMGLSLQQGVFIPGYTTMQREYIEGLDSKESIESPDLIIYTDASGSMKDPNKELSPLTLAATIAVKSALNAGKQVRACNYETPGNYAAMDRMSDDQNEIMKLLLTYNSIEDYTEFPFQDLVDIYKKYLNEPVHLIVISDNDFLGNLKADLNGKTGLQVLQEALLSRKGGGTLFLDSKLEDIIAVFKDFDYEIMETGNNFTKILIPALNLTIYPVRNWNGLDAAAIDMSKATYDPYG